MMQPLLKRFTIPALIALVTLLMVAVAASELRPHLVLAGSDQMAQHAHQVAGDSAVEALPAPALTTPIPLNRGTAGLAAATTFTVEVRSNSSFFPASVTIAPGDTVVWVRTGGFHNVVADDNSFRLGQGSAGNPGGSWTRVSHTFNTVGTFGYFCAQHGSAGGIGMAGTVVVQAPAATPTVTLTPSPTATGTNTSPAPTATVTALPTATETSTTPVPTATATASPTATATSTNPAPTATPTLSPTAIGTTVPPASNKIYMPMVNRS